MIILIQEIFRASSCKLLSEFCQYLQRWRSMWLVQLIDCAKNDIMKERGISNDNFSDEHVSFQLNAVIWRCPNQMLLLQSHFLGFFQKTMDKNVYWGTLMISAKGHNKSTQECQKILFIWRKLREVGTNSFPKSIK